MHLLRDKLVIDPHISDTNNDAQLFGYNFLSCEKKEEFSLDFVINHEIQRQDKADGGHLIQDLSQVNPGVNVKIED